MEQEGVIAQPLLASSAGTATLRYPVKKTDRVWIMVNKEGYQRESRDWRAGDIPDRVTLRLKRSN